MCAIVLRIFFQKHVLKFFSPLCCSVWSNIETSSQVEARALTGKFNILQKVADINMKVKYVFQNSKKSISLLKQITQVCFACNLDSCTLRPEGRYIWAILPERVHHWRNILYSTAKTSKHLIKNNIGQFICILWPSFDHKNIFDKLNRFLRYRHIKMRQWWNAEFHRFCILIWWYLKNIFSLSRTFCWAKLGQSVWLNCPIFLLAKCLLVSAMQDKMWQKKWKLLRENCPLDFLALPK